MIRRFPKAHAAHRLGHGRASLRLRRPAQSLPSAVMSPAPMGHNSMPEGQSEPEWLKERPMSDEWNHDQQHHDQNQGNWQGEQSWQAPEVHQEVHQEAHQPVETFNAPVEPVSEVSRFEAIEAAIAELKANVEALKADLPAAVIHPVADQNADAAEHTPAADGDKLAAIELELSHLRTLIGSVAHSVSEIGADVKAHADLHAETRAIVDEQHQLMRGLNYIITSAIGTLTSAAKQPK